MKIFHGIAMVAALFSITGGVSLAQTTPDTPPAAAAPAPAASAPAATTAPAAASAAPADAAAAKTDQAKTDQAKTDQAKTDQAKTSKKSKSAKGPTRQQEIDRSIDNGTVPARYRRSVPKEYQQYIPFDKR